MEDKHPHLAPNSTLFVPVSSIIHFKSNYWSPEKTAVSLLLMFTLLTFVCNAVVLYSFLVMVKIDYVDTLSHIVLIIVLHFST